MNSNATVSTKLCVVCGKSEAHKNSTRGWCVECMRNRHNQKEGLAWHKRLHVFGQAPDNKITVARSEAILDFLSCEDKGLLAYRVNEVNTFVGQLKAKEAIMAKAIAGLSK